MGITQQSAAARLIQPGVCTSTTRPASPFEGQAIFETDTDRMLIWNGTAWVVPNAPAQNPTGLELISTTTLSSTATSVNNCFTSTYTNYQIVVNFNLSTNGAIDFRFRASGSDNSTSNYRYLYMTQQVDASANTNPVTLSGWNDTKGYLTNAAGAGDNTGALIWEVFAPQVASKTIWSHHTVFEWSGPSIYNRNGAGSFNGTTQFDGFTFISGVTMSGSVSVYGYRK